MDCKIISITVPMDAEMFDETFTPEENYAMLKKGREWIIENRGRIKHREKNRHKYRERLQELEKQIETMNIELQKYGVIFMPVLGK